MKTKFLLMGLPATGKTTTLKTCIDFLNAQGIESNLILTDELIYQRIKADDKVIQHYQIEHQLEIPQYIFAADNPYQTFMATYGEVAICDLEERFLIDIMDSANKNDWFDFGARALMLPRVVKAIEAKKMIPILLYAEHKTVLARLEENECWRQRPTYRQAAENSPDGQGWKTNAEKHRQERLAKYIELAKIIIPVEKSSFDLSIDRSEETQKPVLYKTPTEIAQEIFAEITILEQATTNNRNQFSERCMNFFANKSVEILVDKSPFQETKILLESTLKLRGMRTNPF